jgi:hypothetical protein
MLLNCLRKILEKLMATWLGMMAETHDLLHLGQIGGCPQRSAIDAGMALVHDVEMGKSQGLLTTALFLDVCGAFDNISADRLLQTLHQLSCPDPVISWYATFLTECTIALSFHSQTDQQCPTTTGIPQGSPALPILFLLYLWPLFDALNCTHPTIWSPSYVDDVAIIVQGRSWQDNAWSLECAVTTAFQ